MAAPEFWDAAHAVPFLVAATILGNLTDLNTASFLAKEQTGWLSKNNYVTAIIVTGLYFSMIPLFGYVGAAAALAGGQMIRLLTIHHSARKRAYVDTSLRPLLVMGLIATAGYAIANYVLAQDNLIWDIAVKSAVFAVTACTIVAVLVTHEQSRERLAAIWVSSKVWLNARRVGR
jgi:O-antigen/teichoic acid export membrane protein